MMARSEGGLPWPTRDDLEKGLSFLSGASFHHFRRSVSLSVFARELVVFAELGFARLVEPEIEHCSNPTEISSPVYVLKHVS